MDIVRYYDLEMDGNKGTIKIEDVETSDTFYLVIGVWTDQWVRNYIYEEEFAYEFNVGSGKRANDGRRNKQELVDDCQGCSNVRTSHNNVLWLILLGVVCTRRCQ